MCEDVSASPPGSCSATLTLSVMMDNSFSSPGRSPQTGVVSRARKHGYSEPRRERNLLSCPLPQTSPRATFSLFLHSPERTQPKPREDDCATNRQRHAPRTRLSRMKFSVLPHGTSAQAQRHDQEDNPRNLQPQLM